MNKSLMTLIVMLVFLIGVAGMVSAAKIDDVDLKVKDMDKKLDRLLAQQEKATIYVHGTEYEYVSGRNTLAKVWLQLINSSGDDIDYGVCYTDVYNPNGEEYIENALMTNMEHDGVYYYDFPVPIGQGVYPVIAKCYYESTITPVTASAYTLDLGTLTTGTIDDTWTNNDVYLGIRTAGNPKVFDMNFTFGDFYTDCGGVDEGLLTDLSFSWTGIWSAALINHIVYVETWNYTSNSWVLLPNTIIGAFGTGKRTITNTLSSNNITKTLGVTATNPLKMRFYDDGLTTATQSFDTDYLFASCDQFSSPEWQSVKGSSEVHVKSEHPWHITIDNGEIKGDTFPDFFYYNFTVESGVGVNSSDVNTHIDLPKPFPCHHINNVTIDGVQYNFTLANADVSPESKGCKVSWDQDMTPGVNYVGQIKADNWFKEMEVMWLTEMQFQHRAIDVACNNYRLTMGYDEFVVPRPDTENPFANLFDELYDVCYAYLDVYYHFNNSYFYEYYTPSGVFSADDMLFLDNMYVHMVEGRNELDLIAQAILNVLTTTGVYSQAILADPYNLSTTNWSIVYASLSDGYLNGQKINAITGGAINVSVDTEEIADAVWQYNETINDGILSQIWGWTGSIANEIGDFFAGRTWIWETRNLTYTENNQNLTAEEIWSYSNRELTNIPNVNLSSDAIDEIWNATNRSLTEMNLVVQAVIDNGEVAEYVWNYTNRTTTSTGEVINATELVEDVWNYTAKYTHGEVLN